MEISSPPHTGEADKNASPNLLEKIFDDAFPFYRSIGMTYEEFYNGPYGLVVSYRKTHEIEERRENEKMWRQGLYFYHALCDVSPVLHAFAKSGTTPLGYMDEPIPLTRDEAKKREERRLKRKQEEIRLKMIAQMEKMKKVVKSDAEGQ